MAGHGWVGTVSPGGPRASPHRPSSVLQAPVDRTGGETDRAERTRRSPARQGDAASTPHGAARRGWQTRGAGLDLSAEDPDRF